MITDLYSNGCSFNTTNGKAYIKEFPGQILSDHFGLKLHHFARGGRGNYRIDVVTKIFFETYPKFKPNTLALIEWTSPFRRDYPTNDHWKPHPQQSTTWRTWQTINEIKFIKTQPGYDLDQDHSLFMLNTMLNLQTYFKHNNIKYVMYHGLPSEIDTSFQDHDVLHKSIDWNHVYNPTTSQLDFVNENGLRVSLDDRHPNSQGHIQWSDQLIEFCKKLYPGLQK
jgi:hypothetical protein